MKLFSTSEAAKALGLQRPHLQRAIAQKRITAPKLQRIGGVRVRLWTAEDIRKARQALGRGRRH